MWLRIDSSSSVNLIKRRIGVVLFVEDPITSRLFNKGGSQCLGVVELREANISRVNLLQLVNTITIEKIQLYYKGLMYTGMKVNETCVQATLDMDPTNNFIEGEGARLNVPTKEPFY